MKVFVNKNAVHLEKGYIINRGEYKVNLLEFEFTEEYDDLVKKAIFSKGDIKIEVAILNDECNIPYEVLNEKRFELRVYAYEVENEELVLRYSPSLTEVYTREGSYISGAIPGQEITPSEFEQYMQAMNDGLAEVEHVDIDAVKVGNTSTITITNRNNQTKSVEILDGEDGQDGKDGKDAVSPTVTTSKEGKTTTIVITDAQGSHTATILDGNDGPQGPKGDAGQIKFIVVNTLPTEDIDTNAIYLVPSDPTSTKNIYVEYVYTNNDWEQLGGTPIQIDLTDYVKNTDYASFQNTGVIKAGYYLAVESGTGKPYAEVLNYNTYQSAGDNSFIGKGTLENVITGKNLVNNTDYASNNNAGVVKGNTAYGINYTATGNIYGISSTYSTYQNAGTGYIISKGTLENVITGKGLVSDTDYATDIKGGVMKIANTYGINVPSDTGLLKCYAYNYATYNQKGNELFISKGTLENVITGKDLTTKSYVDGLVGDISSILDTINGEVV